ncbi:putative transcriptional regulators, CopG/Arc/MetJ family protein (plasmid) [Nostoc linckia NIES-25]|nr:putative transcriptional regulators, CopG/Arc/MetJ family protein [Nostoc linckia NIES-25]
MNISLNPEQEEFIRKQIIKGKYTNALEVINAAFKLLEEKDLIPENLHQIESSDFDEIILDFMKISESALNEYWLNEQEDEAWKNL